jgi:hypothetical protein
MNFLDKIKSTLAQGGPEPIALPDAMVFSALNSDEISRQVDLKKRAEENGTRNIPSDSSQNTDSIEDSIITIAMSEVRSHLQNYDSQQAAYQSRLASMDPFALSSKFRGNVDIQKNELDIKIEQEQGNFYLLKESLIQLEEQWTSFKKKWNIESDPRIGISIKTKWIILLSIFIFEVIITATMIQAYVAGGPLEALGYSLMVPTLTLGICGYPVGKMLRELQRMGNLLTKVFYGISCLFLVISAFVLNLFLTYIREAAIEGEEFDAAISYLSSTLTGDFYPISAIGILLYLFSCGLYVGAVIDVMYMEHSIPGLQQQIENRNRLHKEYISRLKNTHDELITLQKNSSVDFNQVFNELNSWQVSYNDIIDHQMKLHQKMKAYISHAENVINSLLKQYREINISHRKTPAPEYFNFVWKFPLNEYLTEPSFTNQKNYSQKLQDAVNEIEKSQKLLNDSFTKIPKLIQGIDELLMKVSKK